MNNRESNKITSNTEDSKIKGSNSSTFTIQSSISALPQQAQVIHEEKPEDSDSEVDFSDGVNCSNFGKLHAKILEMRELEKQKESQQQTLPDNPKQEAPKLN